MMAAISGIDAFVAAIKPRTIVEAVSFILKFKKKAKSVVKDGKFCC